MELEYLRSIGICVEETILNLKLATAVVSEKPEPGKVREGKGQGRGREGRDFRISKTLSQILRHRAMELDIDVRPDGYCLLQEVLECPWVAQLQATQSDVEKIVEGNDKKRFELKNEDGKLMIRATQGHSMKIVEDNELLKNIDLTNLPACCVHGTYRKHVGSILQKGLLAGGRQGQGFRNHVHFSSFSPGDNRVISGMRTDWNCDLDRLEESNWRWCAILFELQPSDFESWDQWSHWQEIFHEGGGSAEEGGFAFRPIKLAAGKQGRRNYYHLEWPGIMKGL